MAEVSLDVEVREEAGKGAGRRLRRAGKIPGVIYGKKIDATGLQVDTQAFQRLVQSGAAGGLIRINFNDTSHVVLVKDVQTDPVLGVPVHVDFHAVALDEDVQVEVPIVIVGEDARASDGGVITQNLRELPISCLPTLIPDSIDVDVSALGVGETVVVGDLQLPEGVGFNIDEEETVLSVVVPQEEPVEEEVAEDEDDDAAEASDDDAADDSEEDTTE